MQRAKHLVFILFICITQYRSYGCDVCGNTVTSNYMGILPQYRQHFVGLRYLNSTFTSQHVPSLFEESGITSSDVFHKAEVWGRFYPTNRLQLFAFVPYQQNTKTEDELITQTSGLADVSVIGNYIVVNSGDSGRFVLRNTLSVGGGVKLPTGKFDPNGNPALQVGTGSWDFTANIIYTLRYKKAGVNLDASTRFNTTNSSGYQFGNSYNSSIRFFYWYKRNRISFLPHAGLAFEYARKDQQSDMVQTYTGGSGVYAVMGADVYINKIAFGAGYTHPLSEHLFEGLVHTNRKLTVQVLYLF